MGQHKEVPRRDRAIPRLQGEPKFLFAPQKRVSRWSYEGKTCYAHRRTGSLSGTTMSSLPECAEGKRLQTACTKAQSAFDHAENCLVMNSTCGDPAYIAAWLGRRKAQKSLLR